MIQLIRKLSFLGLLILCGIIPSITGAAGGELSGAGATFPHPLYSRMFEVYARQSATKIHYEAIGSGAGIKQITKKMVDLGGTDAFMTEKELKAAGGSHYSCSHLSGCRCHYLQSICREY